MPTTTPTSGQEGRWVYVACKGYSTGYVRRTRILSETDKTYTPDMRSGVTVLGFGSNLPKRISKSDTKYRVCSTLLEALGFMARWARAEVENAEGRLRHARQDLEDIEAEIKRRSEGSA